MSTLSDDRITITGLLDFLPDVFVMISVGIAKMIDGPVQMFFKLSLGPGHFFLKHLT
jgi:hypothetical protein